jgi:16S rRNA (cytosine1402-N4)-methyltransferase
VLLQEAIDAIFQDPDGLYIDATFGRGGHSRALLARMGPAGRLVAIDRDPEAVEAARCIRDPRFSIRHMDFQGLDQLASDFGAHAVEGILADLGVSSPQLDEPQRGFGFQKDGPLDMRMDPSQGRPAAEWLSEVSVDDLEEVLRNYGDERHARAIAQSIVSRCADAQRGEAEPLVRTGQLAALIASVLRRRSGGKTPGHHPATRSFQAIRIHINDELSQLEALLKAAPRLLRDGGRLGVISFHSLEDRRVKQTFQASAQSVPRGIGMGRASHAMLRSLATSTPSRDNNGWSPIGRFRAAGGELSQNPRARSAVLRVGQHQLGRSE